MVLCLVSVGLQSSIKPEEENQLQSRLKRQQFTVTPSPLSLLYSLSLGGGYSSTLNEAVDAAVSAVSVSLLLCCCLLIIRVFIW